MLFRSYLSQTTPGRAVLVPAPPLQGLSSVPLGLLIEADGAALGVEIMLRIGEPVLGG